jgi:long-chain acyl-CoA synthetase
MIDRSDPPHPTPLPCGEREQPELAAHPSETDAAVFGRHRPAIPYQPLAELLAQYRARDPDKLAIVDLDQGTSITFSGLERAVTDIAAELKRRGVGHGSRVLLLADEMLEKLLIWLACWRIGAVVAPLNIELNAALIADLASVIDPALSLVHEELDGDALLAGRPFIRFGAYREQGALASPGSLKKGAARRDCSPPPCGEGLGVGVAIGGYISRHNNDPPPQPSPTRGEGAAPSRDKVRASSSASDADPRDDFFSSMARGIAPETLTERNDAADIAAIFCTSGTTSRPKLVVYDHCAYWLVGLSSVEAVGLTADDRTLEYRSFGWNSAQVLSLMPFLQTGLTLHIARRFSHSRFFDWVREHGITFAVGVPTVINMLLNKPLGYSGKDVPSLRLMTCSTAPLTLEQWLRFEEIYGVTLLSMYGMSEAGWICCNRHYTRKMGTVGPPALHQEFDIIDGEGNSCPPGVEGEVTVGGPHCALGYLRDDGSIEMIRGRRIKSGDLAVRDADGFVRVTGRAKDLIIRGGINIAPLEIDAVLLKHPDVAEAAAVGVPDLIYGEEVVCYVVPRSGSSLSASVVAAHCRAALPLPKVPKVVVLVAELPKNDRGKVLREKLKEDWNDRRGRAP